MSVLSDLIARLQDAVDWAESEPSDNQTYREAIAVWRATINEAKRETCPACGGPIDPR